MDAQDIIRQLKGRVTFSAELPKHLDSDIVVGGVVVHHIDLSQFNLPVVWENDEDEAKPMTDTYVTIEDGLGTINLFLDKSIYTDMVQLHGDPIGKLVLFKGFALAFERKTVNPKTKKEYRTADRPDEIRVYATELIIEPDPSLA